MGEFLVTQISEFKLFKMSNLAAILQNFVDAMARKTLGLGQGLKPAALAPKVPPLQGWTS
jgi:hypothetical protein